jgi:hypothetical protein
LESENQLLSSEAEQLRQVRLLAFIYDLSLNYLLIQVRVLEKPTADGEDGRQGKLKERSSQLEVRERKWSIFLRLTYFTE